MKTEFLRGLAIGLAIVAFLAGIAAFVIVYIKKGEISFLPIGISAVILASIMLATRTKKSMDE
ncbi:MAG: hypothetical protein M3405_07710 [Acidobacteriota bacterium]|nr:hypothetical protein [Acidobacteriota bacterium]